MLKIKAEKMGDNFVPMINPTIINRSQQTYIAIERCLSLDGERQVRRHKSIKVGYTTKNGKTKCESYNGFLAQVIQHECDHLNGILI